MELAPRSHLPAPRHAARRHHQAADGIRAAPQWQERTRLKALPRLRTGQEPRLERDRGKPHRRPGQRDVRRRAGHHRQPGVRRGLPQRPPASRRRQGSGGRAAHAATIRRGGPQGRLSGRWNTPQDQRPRHDAGHTGRPHRRRRRSLQPDAPRARLALVHGSLPLAQESGCTHPRDAHPLAQGRPGRTADAADGGRRPRRSVCHSPLSRPGRRAERQPWTLAG